MDNIEYLRVGSLKLLLQADCTPIAGNWVKSAQFLSFRNVLLREGIENLRISLLTVRYAHCTYQFFVVGLCPF